MENKKKIILPFGKSISQLKKLSNILGVQMISEELKIKFENKTIE